MRVGGGAEQQYVLICKRLHSEKQNLVLSKESTPTKKDTGTTVTRPRSQFNSEQSIKSDNVSSPHVSVPVLMGRGIMINVFWVVVDRRELRVGGGAEQQLVLMCKGLLREKQNLVSSKESTPAKDTGTTVTRPRSQFNSEQSIESDNVPPPHVSFLLLMSRGNAVDVIVAVVDRHELRI